MAVVTRGRPILLAVAGVVAVGLLAVAIATQAPPELLREVYTPTFAPVPATPEPAATLRTLWNDLQQPSGLRFLARWLPGQSGVLWLSLVLILLLAWDVERPASMYNADLLATQVLGFLLFDILAFLEHLRQPAYVALMWWVFSAIVAASLWLIVRAMARRSVTAASQWRGRIPGSLVATVAVLLVGLNLAAAAVRPPDDAGFFINLGGQRLRERGLLPYGDPLLTGSAGAGYGPLLYAAHVPFQLLVHPSPVNQVSSPMPPLGADSTYRLPPPLATKLCTMAFHLLGIVALWRIGRRYGSPELAWTLVALYAGSAYVIGVGGDDYFIGGMTFISHIAPAAMLLAGLAVLHRPIAAGLLLTAAAGCGFFPALLAPAWTGYFWDRGKERLAFLGSFLLSGTILGGITLLLSRPAHGRGLVGTILWDTFGHHTDPAGYGSSPFSFWGQHRPLGGLLTDPLIGTAGFTSPVFLLLAGFAVWAFFAARRSSVRQLALLSAAVVIAANLQKIHPTGTYVAWYYPLLLLGFLLPGAKEERR